MVDLIGASTPLRAESTRRRASTASHVWPLSVVAIAAAGTAYIVTHNPHFSGGTYVCPLYGLTGLYCPGCGGTRAVYDLAHGNVADALAMNPLFTLAVPLFGVLWVRWVLRLRGFILRDWPFPNWAGVALPAVIVAFFVLRNWGPLVSLLAP